MNKRKEKGSFWQALVARGATPTFAALPSSRAARPPRFYWGPSSRASRDPPLVSSRPRTRAAAVARNRGRRPSPCGRRASSRRLRPRTRTWRARRARCASCPSWSARRGRSRAAGRAARRGTSYPAGEAPTKAPFFGSHVVFDVADCKRGRANSNAGARRDAPRLRPAKVRDELQLRARADRRAVRAARVPHERAVKRAAARERCRGPRRLGRP